MKAKVVYSKILKATKMHPRPSSLRIDMGTCTVRYSQTSGTVYEGARSGGHGDQPPPTHHLSINSAWSIIWESITRTVNHLSKRQQKDYTDDQRHIYANTTRERWPCSVQKIIIQGMQCTMPASTHTSWPRLVRAATISVSCK